MKRVLSGFALVVLAFALHPAPAQTMSHEEEVVRKTYTRLTTLCELGHVTEVALHTPKLSDAPVYTVSNVTSGNLINISSDPFSRYVSTPADGEEILAVQFVTRQHSNEEKQITWTETRLFWAHSRFVYPETERGGFSPSVADVLQMLDTNTYTSYAAFTVEGRLDGRSTGAYKAIFLFGKDIPGRDVVTPLDRYTHGLAEVLKQSVDVRPISGIPEVEAWLQTHPVPAGSVK